MKKLYLKYAAWAAFTLFAYSTAASTAEFFECISCVIFLYILYQAVTLLWSLIRRKHTWKTKLKHSGIAAVLLFITLSGYAVTESPEDKQAYQDRKAQENYDKQAKYEAWMAQKKEQEQADANQAQQTVAEQVQPTDNVPVASEVASAPDTPTDSSPTQEDYDKQAQYEEWQNYMAQKAYDDQAQYEEWQNYLAQQAYDQQAQYEEWQKYMAQQAYDEQAQYEEWVRYSLNQIKEHLAKIEPDADLKVSDDANGGKILDVTYEIAVDPQKDKESEVHDQFYRVLLATHPSSANPVSKVIVHGTTMLTHGDGVYHEGEGLRCIFTAANAANVDFGSKGTAYSCIKNAAYYYEVPTWR